MFLLPIFRKVVVCLLDIIVVPYLEFLTCCVEWYKIGMKCELCDSHGLGAEDKS